MPHGGHATSKHCHVPCSHVASVGAPAPHATPQLGTGLGQSEPDSLAVGGVVSVVEPRSSATERPPQASETRLAMPMVMTVTSARFMPRNEAMSVPRSPAAKASKGLGPHAFVARLAVPSATAAPAIPPIASSGSREIQARCGREAAVESLEWTPSPKCQREDKLTPRAAW